MTGGEAMTELGAFTVLGFFVLLVVVITGMGWIAQRCGLLKDPQPLPWEESPGGRNDRARLLDEGRVQ